MNSALGRCRYRVISSVRSAMSSSWLRWRITRAVSCRRTSLASITMNSAQQLAKLGNETLAVGNFAGAEKVANAALARDPGNPEAKAIKEAAVKGKAAGRLPRAADPELRLTGAISAPQPPPGS